jgi:hypothetical protein
MAEKNCETIIRDIGSMPINWVVYSKNSIHSVYHKLIYGINVVNENIKSREIRVAIREGQTVVSGGQDLDRA